MSASSSAPIPEWALAVLQRPEGRDVRIEDGIIDLVGDERELASHAHRYGTMNGERIEVLRPSQVRFRNLLGRFLGSLAPGAVVAEIASGEAEFHSLYRHLRYIAMDLSIARVRQAQRLGRVPFAVVADIRSLPLRPSSVDAIVSTNTLNHLPIELLPGVTRTLIDALRPGGRAALTIRTDRIDLIVGELRERGRVVELTGFDGPASSAWKLTLERGLDRLVSIPWKRASETAARGANALAVGMARAERLAIGRVPRLWRQHWIQIERDAC